MSLGFCFMTLCSLNNHFPVFYWTLLLIKIKTFTYFTFITSASVLHISVKLSFSYQKFCCKYHQSCPHYSALNSHELIITNVTTCFNAKWYSSCLLPLRFYKIYKESSTVIAFILIIDFFEEITSYWMWLYFMELFIFYSFIHYFQYFIGCFWTLLSRCWERSLIF